MAKPISKNDYNRFVQANRFWVNNREPIPFSKSFIKVFAECRGLISRDQVARIKDLAKHSEKDAKDYIEMELVKGMGDSE